MTNQQSQDEDENEDCVGTGFGLGLHCSSAGPIDWSKVFKSVDQANGSHKPDIDHQVIRLIDGPLAGQVKRLEHAERIIVFTTDAGAVQYIRSKSNRAYSEYLHLTKELQEQMEFDREMFKLGAMLDNPEISLRWVVKFPYSVNKSAEIRACGFRWDQTRREWYLLGSINQYGADIREAEKIIGKKIECEPIES